MLKTIATLAAVTVLATPAAASTPEQVAAQITGTVTLTLPAANAPVVTGNESVKSPGGPWAQVPVNSGFTALPLTHDAGDELLDYTDPERPTVKTAGVYDFDATVVCVCDQARAGGLMIVVGVGRVSHDQMVPFNPWPFARASTGVHGWRLAAGDPVQVLVMNGTGRTLAIEVELATVSRTA